MLPRVVDYLRSGKTLEDLELEHGVFAVEYNGKVSLCYHQIDAREDDILACQCRGLILRKSEELDGKDTWDVVAYPFDRFYNLGQGHAATIDWTTARVQEKLDGTLIIVYHDEGRWQCATRRDPEAHTASQSGATYRQMVELALQDAGWTGLDHFMTYSPEDFTYMFELTAPENQVVCRYPDRQLTLLGMRDMLTFREVRPFLDLKAPLVQEYPALDLDAVVEMVNQRDPEHHEGVVVVDGNFNRVKIKSEAYVFIHNASSAIGSSWRNVVRAIVNGTADDVEPLVSDYVRDRIRTARQRLGLLMAETIGAYQCISHIDDMKEFAGFAKRARWPAALFAMKRNHVFLSEFLDSTNPKTLVELCRFESQYVWPLLNR